MNDYERVNHFEYIPQPGGDAVTKHPWRMMTASLYHYFGEDVVKEFPFLFENIDEKELELILFSLKNKVNAPLTSSTGRLFDSVSALLNVCRHSTYHAEAPMRLEAVADKHTEAYYTVPKGKPVSLKTVYAEIISDLRNKVDSSVIAGRFHNTIVRIITRSSHMIRDKYGINKVALSGGTFQNRIILEKTENQLLQNGFQVFSQSSIPSNDGGIALGQLAIAAKRRELGLI